MSANNLYVATCRVVLEANPEDHSTFSELYNLLPCLRQSLSCAVCSDLLTEPYTPADMGCQHHVCKACLGGRKLLKPACQNCRSYENYSENVQLRILLQCYRKICEYIRSAPLYDRLTSLVPTQGDAVDVSGLIQEACGDEVPESPPPRPQVSTSTASTQTLLTRTNFQVISASNMNSGSETEEYSENKGPLFVGVCTEDGDENMKRNIDLIDTDKLDVNMMKKLKSKSPRVKPKRKGCRCGNATPTPGKLTCCGQRCPCYVEAKACMECRCRGCRNPYRSGGRKVRPHIPHMENIKVHIPPSPHMYGAEQEVSQQQMHDDSDTEHGDISLRLTTDTSVSPMRPLQYRPAVGMSMSMFHDVFQEQIGIIPSLFGEPDAYVVRDDVLTSSLVLSDAEHSNNNSDLDMDV